MAPVAVGNNASVALGEPVSIDVLANDTDHGDDLDSNRLVIARPPVLAEVRIVALRCFLY